MNTDEYIKGAFLGALILCVLMLVFPEHKSCVIELQKGNQTHIYVGKYYE